MKKTILPTMTTVAIMVGVAQGQEYQSLESISDAAINHLQLIMESQQLGETQISSGQLDKRLRLHQCDRALETFMPSGAKETGNTTVGVRCNGSKPWMIYVPVSVSQWGDVLVAARPLTKGLVGLDDFKPVPHNLSILSRGFVLSGTNIAGKKLKTPLIAGAVLRPDMLETPNVVSKGQRVTLVSGQGGLQVRMPGKALSGGAPGDRIQVENSKSKRVIEGLVAENGTVLVGI